MAQIYDMPTMVRQHFTKCAPEHTFERRTPERDCHVWDGVSVSRATDEEFEALSDECFRLHGNHARQCDRCGADMATAVRKCAHCVLTLHHCPTCGYERTYAGNIS